MMKRVVCGVLNLFVIMLHSKLVSSQLPSDQVSALTSVYDILQNNTAPSFVWNNVLKASNPCSWRGVGCTPDNSSINTISFQFFSISTSEFLPFLCNISTLESLDVSENHLSSIPNAFFTNCGGISGLKILNFSGNSFIGPLPTFNGFAMLEYLDFSRNSFSGEISLQLDELGSLKSLSNAFSLGSEPTRHQAPDAGSRTEGGILKNVSRTKAYRRGYGSLARGRDSRDWHKEDRRRSAMDNIRSIVARINNKSFFNKSRSASGDRGNGLHNEAGRDELKMFEAKYEASLKIHGGHNQQSVDADEYDDGMEFVADVLEDLDDGKERSYSTIPRSTDTIESSHTNRVEDEKRDVVEEADNDVSDLYEETPPDPKSSSVESHSQRTEGQPARRLIPESRTKKKPKNRKVAAATCTMRILNSTATLVEPLESRNFANFLLQYVEKEDKPINKEKWEPRFSGHQTLKEREDSFIARDQNIKCGFVNGPDGSSTGFDLDEDDAKYISSCHIVVSSCIFGNSDRLRSPMGKTVSRLSKKNVCFIMFVDEATLQTLSSEGKMRDEMGFIGLWKVVVVKNLPYSDMRRVGKIPKLLPHRLFPSARYSIWLDSKLRLTLDPLLILEYFLWRKGYEYAISNHYDRHCLWEEVARNKRLNKYNHSVIDEQFRFYQSDGMRRFNASDPDKLLPSNVPEGSFIVRAHTPMSNLFSCLWFNEVDRFTPRDQLSFAYTYYKLSRMNPGKRFYLNMFKDCERRKIAKLYRHRSEEKRASSHIDL